MLESKARKLREALTYIEHPEKESELRDLVTLWRAGGREVVERLFVLIPKPDEAKSDTYYDSHSSPTPLPWSTDTARGHVLTLEQRDYLARAPTNDEGDPVDYEGNLLLPDVTSQKELMRLVENEAAMGERRHGKQGGYIPTNVAS